MPEQLAIYEGDFFTLITKHPQLNTATVYIVYLLKDTLHRLDEYFKESLQKNRNVRLISFFFPHPTWKPAVVSDDSRIFIYTKESILDL